MSKSTKGLALRLTLGGAPSTPHTITGLPGLYRAGELTPVGGAGEPSEEQAREADSKRGTPVELVEVTAAELDKARERHQDDVAHARDGLIAARKAGPSGAEVEQVNDERTATSGARS